MVEMLVFYLAELKVATMVIWRAASTADLLVAEMVEKRVASMAGTTVATTGVW